LQETRLLLIRHAETATPNVFHGAESDIGLSAWGEQQAVLLGERLANIGADALYCSGMRRAIATARPIGEACGLTPEVVVDLHERRIGSLSGQTREAGWEVYDESKRRWVAGDLEYTHPGGESFADVGRRVLPIFETLRRRHDGGTIIVVAHGIVIRIALLNLLPDRTPADFDRIAIDFASINELTWDGSGWNAVALNEVVAPSPARPVA
jgi:2,3-bisphosphoglycerate-dependent phosphoglycerate mutase